MNHRTKIGCNYLLCCELPLTITHFIKIVARSEWFQFCGRHPGSDRLNNLDLKVNHIVQDSEVFPPPACYYHPNSTRHRVDWLLIQTVRGDYTAQSRAGVYRLSNPVSHKKE